MKKNVLLLLSISFLLLSIPGTCNEEQQISELPSSFSWTNIDGVDYTTAIKDQSPAPTCETYALCASLETLMQYQLDELYNPDLSETHLYFYAGGTYERGGVNVYDACEYLVEYGVPDEGCYPDPHRPYDYPYTSVGGWENRTMKISEWGWIPNEEDAIKQALIDYGPLIICIFVYEDMYDYHGGVYHRSSDNRIGGHLVALVGYDDDQGYWLVKNSWGDRWGDNGWFLMGYDPDMFIDGCYGGESGIIYIDGIYGNFDPDVPKIQIEQPKIFHTYLFGIAFPQLIRIIPGIQAASPRILGPITIKVSAENTEKIDFYVDDVLEFSDDTAPFEWQYESSQGLHVVETIAYDADGEISRDIVDVYSII